MVLVYALLAVVSMAAVIGSRVDGPTASSTPEPVGIDEERAVPYATEALVVDDESNGGVPDSLAFADASVGSSLATIPEANAPVGVHSAPGRLYTRLGRLVAETQVGLTGYQVRVDDETWAEIIWRDTTAWIPLAALD